MKPTLPMLLSFNGGYVDTAGFLALQGLFTAHVTGNFVTFGAAIALGTSGATGKLLALPVFCIVLAIRMVGLHLPALGLPVLRSILLLKIALLAVAAVAAIAWGPFSDGDSWQALVTGMILVSAMAIQNAVHRIHLSKDPPSTLMTGTSTQIMIDIADLLNGRLSLKERADAQARLAKMSRAVGVFALGCAAAALIFMACSMYVFLVPPMMAVFALLVTQRSADPQIA